MDKDTRNAIERATQRARKLIEEDFAAQLEGDFDVHCDGAVAATAGSHLSARKAFQRERIVAAIDHKRATGMNAADAARDYLRDAAFTTVNRFVALKMLEARDLVQECVTKGEQSTGYREFCGMAPGLALLPDSSGYRLYIESIFDELSTEVKVLFDRRDPSSVLWPKRATFEQLLENLNSTELARVWGEDETIGWVYQFFNGQDERRKMREESQAPRNSRELAVRNQFFTPRYVVQFLTDNTLGRIWYEMRSTKTALAYKCEYMVRKPDEDFAPRPKTDPRDLRVLDPACGSGHFLLYAFDLLVTIYEEAYADPESPKSEATGRTLNEDYPSLDALRKAVPGLVLAHNLHGVDIDLRCAQIAQLALWMRAQKVYRDFGIRRAERLRIRRSNIVVAEPLVTDEQIANEFMAKLGDPELKRVFASLVASPSLAGDLGVLLRIEKLVAAPSKQGRLFAPPEELIRAVLDSFISENPEATDARRQLFAEDVGRGVGLLEIAEEKYDVVLMNPPFGDPPHGGKEYIFSNYGPAKTELFAAMVDRGMELCRPGGRCGALTSRSGYFLTTLRAWREPYLEDGGDSGLVLFADLGGGVLDAAVECAAAVFQREHAASGVLVMDATRADDDATLLKRATSHIRSGDPDKCVFHITYRTLQSLPERALAYWAPPALLHLFDVRTLERVETSFAVKQGIATSDNGRFLRLWWEVSESAAALPCGWIPYAKGGTYSPFVSDFELALLWRDNGAEVKAFSESKFGTWTKQVTNTQYFGQLGLTYPRRTHHPFAPAILPRGMGFDVQGACLFPKDIAIDEDALRGYLSLFSSRLFNALVELGLARTGNLAKTYPESLIAQAPIPPLNRVRQLSVHGASATVAQRSMVELDESSQIGAPLVLLACNQENSWGDLLTRLRTTVQQHDRSLRKAVQSADTDVYDLYCVSEGQRTALSEYLDERFGRVDEDPCRASGYPPSSAEIHFAAVNLDDGFPKRVARAVVSQCVGRVFGRWSQSLSSASEGLTTETQEVTQRTILVDDPGHIDDIERLARSQLKLGNEALLADVVREIYEGDRHAELREYLRNDFFADHIALYSKSRRKAPIYWQLSTPSAGYSVWLYIHALNRDTLFRVQNDYVAPKLAHEERRLESLAGELSDGASPAQRRRLAAQEKLVDELRAFLDDLRRVTPLWKPNLDDGVAINFAPLWRLVPQIKSWQKELKATWDALCEGKYDWAHLAMHLWPERVVSKCAEDRSLAIAHGLEDVFWVGSTEGKWTARKAPTRGVDELVRERTSPAVVSALKILLDAPASAGKSGGRRGGSRRKGAAAAEGGDA